AAAVGPLARTKTNSSARASRRKRVLNSFDNSQQPLDRSAVIERVMSRAGFFAAVLARWPHVIRERHPIERSSRQRPVSDDSLERGARGGRHGHSWRAGGVQDTEESAG